MHLSLCDFLSDITQNSLEAGASLVKVKIRQTLEDIEFCVEDNGKGMREELLKKVTDPFYSDKEKHIKRRVGLGIPFLIQATEAVDGQFSLQSQEGEGTTVTFKFPLNHIDCPPIGDIALTILSLLIYSMQYEVEVTRTYQNKGYVVVRSQLEEVLEDFSSPANLFLLKQYLRSQEAALDDN
jgi:hypothetical protein